MDKKGGVLFLAAAAPLFLALLLPQKNSDPNVTEKLRAQYSKKHVSSVNHSKFKELQGPFANGQEVTKACISCHNKRHEEVMQSSHWNWSRSEYVAGRGIIELGKKNVLNNFCIGVGGNEQSCAKCHIGYGEDKQFNFKDPNNVDCLACHDGSSNYVKASGGHGMPDPKVDLKLIAQSVGRPSRTNCGTCHFYGGGGDGVKHGDLDSSLFATQRTKDVHMAPASSDLSCVDCHTAENHQMKGKLYSVSSMNRNRVECSSCHGEQPHEDLVINRHMAKVSCQSCHIPSYATTNPTKMEWDWSAAGRLKNGKPFEEEGPFGKDKYLSIKGSFKWEKDVVPEYIWFNGTADHYLVGDKVDPAKPVQINKLHGSYDDPDAKLIPVKVHRAVQPYDPVTKLLIQPKTFSDKPGDGGYWAEFDWKKASEAGMAHIGQPFSGKVSFTKTEMTWPINHLVVPKDKAVACSECHTRDKGRLAKVTDFYLPGRDRSIPVDAIGRALVIATLAGVSLHGIARAFAAKQGAKNG